MKNLTLNDLKLGLTELLDPNGKRFSVLVATKAWMFYGDDLQLKQRELHALPPDVTGATRYTTEVLNEADEQHDGFGGALYYQTEAYMRAPDTSRELKVAAQELRDAFITKLAELRGSYSDESTRAKERLPNLDIYKDKLQLFPIAGGKTLYDWAKGYIYNGIKLADLMSERAYTEASLTNPVKSKAALLRGEVIRTVFNLRALLQQELKQNPSLPPNLDALLFGLLDELQLKRQAAIAPTLPNFPVLSLPPTDK
jgi:hypothetical protein